MIETIMKLDSIFKNGLVSSGLNIAIIITILIIINRIITKFIKKRWTTSYVVPMRIKRAIIWTVALTSILLQIKPLQSFATTLLASGGFFAVIIGLASQEAASSMINGAMIFTFKPFNINDTISMPERNVRGKVLDITLRHTVLETHEKTKLIIPNTIMNQSMVENISSTPNKKANYLQIEINYLSDLDHAITIIQELADNHPFCIDPRSNKQKKQNVSKIPVHCTALKEKSISLQATIYSKDNSKGFEMLSDLRKQLVKTFEEQGIVILNS